MTIVMMGDHGAAAGCHKVSVIHICLNIGLEKP